ncbi:MAG: hypothetical protein NW223_22585 [Hyphomicrobiaceae bacterium]|nr:hypothetical protein [Hyphomicrobiaceae bacterium]
MTVIVLHGSSKQGKSSVLRNNLRKGSFLQISGGKGLSPESVFRDLLNQCGAVVGGGVKTSGSGELKANLAVVSFKLGGSAGVEHKEIAADLANPASVARVLNQCTKLRTIVIENFHFFDADVQVQLAQAMRTFEDVPNDDADDDGFQFVVLGTWNSEDYLQSMANLAGRVQSISVDPWLDSDLEAVFDAGAPHLNVRFGGRLKKSLITYAHGNVGLLQELILATIEKHRVLETAATPVTIENYSLADQAAHEIMGKESDSVLKHLRVISDCGANYAGGKTRSHWILKAFLSGEQATIEDGYPLERLLEETNALVRAIDKKVELLSPQAFNLLVKRQWLEYQLDKITSPLIVFDGKKSLVILDGWAKLVLKLNRRKIAQGF